MGVLEGRHCFRGLSVQENLVAGGLGRGSGRGGGARAMGGGGGGGLATGRGRGAAAPACAGAGAERADRCSTATLSISSLVECDTFT